MKYIPIAIVQIEDKQKSINCSVAVHPQLSYKL
jgi:hypothetical protein